MKNLTIKRLCTVVLSLTLTVFSVAELISCKTTAGDSEKASVESTSQSTSQSASESSSEKEIQTYTYKTTDGGVLITGYTGNSYETLKVPEKIADETVIGIADNAFNTENTANNADALNAVKTIVFKGEIKTVGNYNFYGMNNITEVVLPSSVTTVGSQCFFNCASLKKVSIPAGAEMDFSRSPFANCPELTEVHVPANISGFCASTAFASANTNLVITFDGNSNFWYYMSENARENLSAAKYVYNNGKTLEKDNGQEYILNSDGNSYTLAGFYDTVKNTADNTAVTSYFVQSEYKGKPITAIGPAVFNSKAYASATVAAWLKSELKALIIGIGTANGNSVTWTDNNVKNLGNYNFVSLEVCTQLRTPSVIDNTTLCGCYIDLNATSFIRVPRGVKIMNDCFQWSGSFMNGVVTNWLVLPMLDKFTGNSWTGKASGFGIMLDCSNDTVMSEYDALLNRSTDIPQATRDFFKTFSHAIVLGSGGAGLSYDWFLVNGF